MSDMAAAPHVQNGINKEEKAECAICYDDVDHNIALKLPCKHRFHPACMNDWARQNRGQEEVTCPQCRAPISHETLQQLQNPLGLLDLLALPVMLTAMVFQIVYENVCNAYAWGCAYAKRLTVCVWELCRRFPEHTMRLLHACHHYLRNALSAISQQLSTISRLVRAGWVLLRARLDLCAKLCAKLWQGLAELWVKLCGKLRQVAQPLREMLMARLTQALRIFRSCISTLVTTILSHFLQQLRQASTLVRTILSHFLQQLRQASTLVHTILSHFLQQLRHAARFTGRTLSTAANALTARLRYGWQGLCTLTQFIVRTVLTAKNALAAWFRRAFQRLRTVTEWIVRTLLDSANFLAGRLGYVRDHLLTATQSVVQILLDATQAVTTWLAHVLDRLRSSAQSIVRTICNAANAVAARLVQLRDVIWQKSTEVRDVIWQKWTEVCGTALGVCEVLRTKLHTALMTGSLAFADLLAVAAASAHAAVRKLQQTLQRCGQAVRSSGCYRVLRSFVDKARHLLHAIPHTCHRYFQAACAAAKFAAGCGRDALLWTARQIPVDFLAEKYLRLAEHLQMAAHWAKTALQASWDMLGHMAEKLLNTLRRIRRETRSAVAATAGKIGRVVARGMEGMHRLLAAVTWIVRWAVAVAEVHVWAPGKKRLREGCTWVKILGSQAASSMWAWMQVLAACVHGWYNSICNSLHSFVTVSQKSWRAIKGLCNRAVTALDNTCITVSQKSWRAIKGLCNRAVTALNNTCTMLLSGLRNVCTALVRGVVLVVKAIGLVVSTICLTLYNVVYRPRCAVCQRGVAKLRTLCFTCVGDHLVPRCYDCGRGWCKLWSRCFSCFMEHIWPRCSACHLGHVKLKQRCFTCLIDLLRARCRVCGRGWSKLPGALCVTCYLHAHFPACTVCQRGRRKLRGLCWTCLVDVFIRRCSVCGRGWNKLGSQCLTCALHNMQRDIAQYCSALKTRVQLAWQRLLLYCTLDLCTVCHRGYGKFGGFCTTCFIDNYQARCRTCGRGWRKLGVSCFTCAVDRYFPRCGMCSRGYAKFGMRCFTCYRKYILNPPPCFYCRVGCSKLGEIGI
eukprot:g13001.t1